MPDLTTLTLCQSLAGLKRRDFSSRELAEAYLSCIEAFEPEIHAFITTLPEHTLADADSADDIRRRQAENCPPLTGLPIAIKDLLCMAGFRCTCGSKILESFIPPFTATAVQHLLDAGMIPLGKTNTDEFAMGSSTENSAFGPTHNPWRTDRVPGGSSGGSAAAVAARMAPVAIGTDTGGSVRQPCAFCGTTGIKPTYGRISRFGLVAYGSSLDSVGVIGRDIPDISLLFKTMAGFDPLDATSADRPVPEITLSESSDLNGKRIGVPKEYFIPGMQPEVEAAVRKAIQHLEELGSTIIPISLPHTDEALPVYYLIAPAEASANLARYDGIRYGQRLGQGDDLWEMVSKTRGELLGAEVKRRIMLGTYALSAGYYDAYYGKAQKVRTLIKQDFDLAFEQVDLIAAPVTPTTAFKLGEHSNDPLEMYLQDVFTLPANLAGIPALALPVGYDQNGLPIGMQLMGPFFSEAKLFQTGHAYQMTTKWHTQLPQMPIQKSQGAF